MLPVNVEHSAALRRVAIASLAMIASYGLFYVTAPIASAAQCVDNGNANYYDGGNSSGSTSFYGVRAKIESRPMNTCGNSGSTSFGGVSAWTLLQANSVTTGKPQFAQVGYAQTGAFSRYGFNDRTIFSFNTKSCYANATCGQNSPISYSFYNVTPPAGMTFYSVYLDGNDDRITMANDGVVYKKLNFDVTGKWEPFWGGVFSGETFDAGDNMPGTVTNKTSFESLQWFNSTGGINNFSASNVYARQDRPGVYKRETYNSGTAYRIWTER